jgi:hypothetical protein
MKKLAREIVRAVRAEAAKIPDFDNGAIRLLFAPKCAEAEHWLGDNGVDETVCETDFGYVIKKGFGHTRPNGWRGEDDGECDCYGYAALKIAGCAYAIKHGLGHRSSDMPAEAVTWGRENDPGCVGYCVEISSERTYGGGGQFKPYLRVYVSVSGATSEEDERCALAAGVVIERWCESTRDDRTWTSDWRWLYVTGKPEVP